MYVDSCWLNTPNPQLEQNISLFARVKNNNSEEKREVNITLEIDGQQKAIATKEVANEEVIELNFTVDTIRLA